MPGPSVLVLNSGGLRSLVATALVRAERPDIRVSVLHIVDGRENLGPRRDHVRRQCEHFNQLRLHEVAAPTLFIAGRNRGDDAQIAQFAVPQLLLLALEHAQFHGLQRVVWPASGRGDFHAVARGTERMQLAEHLAGVGSELTTHLDAPLLEMTDAQVIELGAQMSVPWHLAWSCVKHSDEPCFACVPCRRRHDAFAAAGMRDPVEQAVALR